MAADADETVLLGEIGRPWGVSGEVVVRLHADDPARLDEVASVLVAAVGAAPREARVEGWKVAGGRVVVKLSGVDTPESARALSGGEIRIARAVARRRPPEGRLFAYQLEGLRVLTAAGEELGRVARVLVPAGQTLLEVAGGRGTFLIPAVAALCRRIDLEAGTIVVDLPEGLVDLNAV